MKKFNESSDFRELIYTARQLGIYPFGRSKYQLAMEVNAEIDRRNQAVKEASAITIDLDDAMEALTEAEFTILTTLINKVEAAKTEDECPCGGLICGKGGWLDMINNLPPVTWGSPGVGKSANMEEVLEKMGFQVIYFTDGE